MPMRFEALQAVAIAASQERSLKVVLEGVVRGVSQSGGLALARVWLLGPDSVCEVCRRLPGIPDQSERLHLMASAGRPVSSVYRNEDWSRLDGDFHRGGIKIAEVNGTAKPVLVSIENDHRWIERPDWARRERIRSFAGHPLIFRGQGVGAIGVFSRRLISEAEFDWLRLFAIAAAVTISNARAFDEIDRLRQRLEGENAYLRDEITTATDGEIILGNSASMRRVLEQIEMVAPTDATVLVVGETGVGKEVVARTIHAYSGRRQRALLKVNCTAIPRELFESEFFGHVKGAFSGAISDRLGRFQLADGGTLFLDEVGDLAPEMQPKLLRVLQEGEFEAVGDSVTRRANVRMTVASNHDLKARSAQHASGKTRRAGGLSARFGSLQFDIPSSATSPVEPNLENAADGEVAQTSEVITDAEMKRRERDNIVAALTHSHGRIYGRGGAAELLGMRPTTLSARLKKLRLKPNV
jgi:transcriptional regulator with GAF, ATPase, and Fis domain